jgi:hypothetical protein
MSAKTIQFETNKRLLLSKFHYLRQLSNCGIEEAEKGSYIEMELTIRLLETEVKFLKNRILTINS